MIEKIRSYKKNNTISLDIETDEGELLNDVSDFGSNDPLLNLTKKESIRLLQEVIRKELSEREQLIIARILNGDKQKEIAKDLNTNKQYISNTYKTAIQKIRNGFSSSGMNKVEGVLDLKNSGKRTEKATERDSVHCAFTSDFKCKDCGKKLKYESSIYCKECLVK